MPRQPVLFNEPRLQAMMDREGIDLVILRGTENSKYITEFFHNGGNLGYRPFTVFYFRDPARKPAFVVPGGRPAPGDDVDLDRGRARLRDGGVLHRPRRAFLPGLLRGRAGDPRRSATSRA